MGVKVRVAMASLSCAMELAAGSSLSVAAAGAARALPSVMAPSLRVGLRRNAPGITLPGMVRTPSSGAGVGMGMVRGASEKVSEAEVAEGPELGGVVRGVLFDMDGVLCDSEHCSRQAAVELFSEMGYAVREEDFIPFMGTGRVLSPRIGMIAEVPALSLCGILKCKLVPGCYVCP